jgi:hypothetical protein
MFACHVSPPLRLYVTFTPRLAAAELAATALKNGTLFPRGGAAPCCMKSNLHYFKHVILELPFLQHTLFFIAYPMGKTYLMEELKCQAGSKNRYGFFYGQK